jgi:hypothetical protein
VRRAVLVQPHKKFTTEVVLILGPLLPIHFFF